MSSVAPVRWPELDGLRGLAILLVIPHNVHLYHHAQGLFRGSAMLANVGWVGVQLFFVLSGFLITHNLLLTRGAGKYFRSFYARRALRILPLYYLMLVGFLWVLPRLVALSPDILATYVNQPWLWVFLSNWRLPPGGSVYWFSHFWSLAVEEQFYLVWPIVVLWLRGGRLAAFVVAVIAAAIAVRYAWFASGVAHDAIYTSTLCRMDALACGALVALVVKHDELFALLRRHAGGVLWAAIGLLLIVGASTGGFATSPVAMVHLGYTGLALAFALLVLLAASGVGRGVAGVYGRLCRTAPLRSVGRVSYAMYVVHLPLFLLLKPLVDPWVAADPNGAPLGVAIVMTVLSYLVGRLSYHLIERHALALKRYFVARAPSAG